MKLFPFLNKKNKTTAPVNQFLLDDPVENIILFESHPELSGNSYELFLYFIKENLNKQYKLYWLVEDTAKYKNYHIDNVYFLPLKPNNQEESLNKRIIIHKTKVIISENRHIARTNINTFSLHLHHGTVLKDVSGIFNFGRSYNCILCPSEHLIELYRRIFKVEESQMFISGYPRSDVLLDATIETKKKLQLEKYSKIILWMPTFRQHKNQVRIDSENVLPLGIPIFRNENELTVINDYLKSVNCLLVLKLHPAQDKSYINVDSLSHIKIMEDEELTSQDVKLYEFIGVSDALITDYSSVYFDYLLTQKPIGLTIDDLNEYKLGFVYKDIENYLIGEQLSTINDLEKFIQNVVDGIDPYLEAREKVNQKMNQIRKEKTFTESIFENIIKPNL